MSDANLIRAAPAMLKALKGVRAKAREEVWFLTKVCTGPLTPLGKRDLKRWKAVLDAIKLAGGK